MADKEAKWTQNVEGEYYVDDQCIACDACCVEAPAYFAMNTPSPESIVELSNASKFLYSDEVNVPSTSLFANAFNAEAPLLSSTSRTT